MRINLLWPLTMTRGLHYKAWCLFLFFFKSTFWRKFSVAKTKECLFCQQWLKNSPHLGRAWWWTVAHACNPSKCSRAWWLTRSRDPEHPGQHGETLSLLKVQKISWAQRHMPVIPATQETEAGESLEPRKQRLWWAEIAPLHSSLNSKSKTPSQKTNKQKDYVYVIDPSM